MDGWIFTIKFSALSAATTNAREILAPTLWDTQFSRDLKLRQKKKKSFKSHGLDTDRVCISCFVFVNMFFGVSALKILRDCRKRQTHRITTPDVLLRSGSPFSAEHIWSLLVGLRPLKTQVRHILLLWTWLCTCAVFQRDMVSRHFLPFLRVDVNKETFRFSLWLIDGT